jgi:transcriptional regulator with XRE-family HTH domain
MSLGKAIKLRRIELDMPARVLAERVGVSPSTISKIENDVLSPSLDLLRKIVAELDVSYRELLVEPDEGALSSAEGGQPVTLVKAGQRKTLRIPARGPVFEILTPNLQGSYEFVWIEQAPGEGGDELFAHETGLESVLVMEGVLQVTVAESVTILEPGDCLTFDATLPHRYQTRGSEKAVWVYVAAPPSL